MIVIGDGASAMDYLPKCASKLKLNYNFFLVSNFSTN